MLQNLRKRNEGFTIIEVLIVLAIAGLILLVVFLAVPALQRNSRNTQAKNAASSLLGAISEFENNNNGAMPTTVAYAADGTTVDVTGGAGTTAASTKIQGGYTLTVSTAFPAATSNTGTFTIGIGQKCSGNTAFVAAPRSVAIGFIIETSGSGKAQQCVES